MGDWLGMGTIAPQKREYRPFEEARKFVHALELKTQKEWNQYCKGELERKVSKPEDIPANPSRTYKDRGWQGMGDWLGTGTIAPQKREYRPFEEARKFLHPLKLKRVIEWGSIVRKSLRERNPNQSIFRLILKAPTKLKAGKTEATDWGRAPLQNFRKKYRSFEEARKFVHALKLKNQKEWRQYCKGELGGREPKPEDIPVTPNRIYKDRGWQSMGDWLGTGTIAPQKRKYRSFEEAREFVHALELKSQKEWKQYCKGKLEGKISKPEDIPVVPDHIYKSQGWQGWGDWLGTGTIANYNRKYRSFEEAREFVHALELKRRIEWVKYCKGELEGMEPKPGDIPASPRHTYKSQGWQGWGDWLRKDTIAKF